MSKSNKTLHFVPLFFWMIIILFFSLQSGTQSAQLSGGILSLISNVFESIGIIVDPSSLHFLIRKIAHFAEYAVLAILAMFALRPYDFARERKLTIVFVFGVLFAIFDESLQTLIPDRVGSPVDVMIDAVGTFFGLLIVKMHLKRKERSI